MGTQDKDILGQIKGHPTRGGAKSLHFAELLERFRRQMADYEEEVGHRIRRARLHNRPDLTSHEAAAREFGNISSKQWGRWERGESLPRAANWNRLAEVLRMEVTDLRGDPPAIAENDLADQLDRIEAKLDLLLQSVIPSSPAEVAEEAAARRTAGKQPATGSGRAGKSRSRRAA
jgi:transcriptional regulator with XRE-family HTH domain